MRPYPLAAVLALRGHDEARARAALARALAAEALRAEARDAAASRVAEHAARIAGEERATTPLDGAAIAALALRARHRDRLRVEAEALAATLRESERVLSLAREEASEARAALGEARRAVRALERHREGWRAGALRVLARREEAEADDRRKRP